MKVANKSIRILVVFLFVVNIRCQDGYPEQKNNHMQEMSSNEGQVEAMTGYSANVIQSDPSQSISSVNVNYRMNDDAIKNSDYNRAERGKTRKIFRIKNPFQQPEEEDESKQQNINISSQDSETGTSNQYAAMQYSLPPEEFLQQMRAENQYHQQQQSVSTPTPTFGNTATPQPQYSTISASYYNSGNQQNNPMSQLQSKNPSIVYNPNLNNYQYNNAYSFGIDGIQSTPSSVTLYLSTNTPSNQYVGTLSSNYVSSPPPIYLSSPTNLQPYISSTLSNLQTGSPSYYNNNRHSTTIENNSFNYGSNSRDTDHTMQVNHYDNSANGVQYPINIQQHYQTEFASSTPLPMSSPYPDSKRDPWQNAMNYGLNGFSNIGQESTQTHQQNFKNNQEETFQDFNKDNQNSDTNRIGSLPSANNLVLSFVQPDYQTFTNLKNHGKNIEQQIKHSDVYSHGDYGWKLDNRKTPIKYDVNTPANYPKNQSYNYQTDSTFNPSNRYLENGKPYNNDEASKLNFEKLDAQEFARAAAKAHESWKKQQQIYLNNYSSHTRYPQNVMSNIELGHGFFGNDNSNNQKGNIFENPNMYGNAQPDLITAPPYYFLNSRENMFDEKIKQPYDHEKVMQNIVKFDAAYVTPNTDTQTKINNAKELSNEYNFTSNTTDINKQFLKPVTEAYYQDKNMIYGFDFRSKPGEVSASDGSNRVEPGNEKQYGPLYNSNSFTQKQPDGNSPSFHYLAQSNLNNVQPQNNVQTTPRFQNQRTPDISNNLKLNDIPFWLTQGLNTGNLRLNNNFDHRIISAPTPIILNQNVESHQLDVAASILNKLMRDKQVAINSKPQYDSQTDLKLADINGLKVVNPYNLDLKLVSEILKGRTASNDINTSFYNHFNQPTPVRWDMSQLKPIMLKNDNIGQPRVFNEDISKGNNPFFEVHNNGRYPYPGVKYSRSQEEEESLIPITATSHNHPIGAVVEEDELQSAQREVNDSDVTGSNDDFSVLADDENSKSHSNYRMVSGRYIHPNSLTPVRHTLQRKNPKTIVEEPHPLLQPPPINTSRGRIRNKFEMGNRRKRLQKMKHSRIVKREPLFEDESSNDDLQPLLQPPPPAAEDKSDNLQIMES